MIQKIEAQLRAHPDDLDTLLIYADALLEQGDPRGEIIALQHAIAVETDPAASVRLDKSLRQLIARHRSSVLGKPGGFPFRDAWWGRGYMSFELRSRTPELLSDVYPRVVRFLTTRTNCSGPSSVSANGNLDYIGGVLGPGYTGPANGHWSRKPGLTTNIHDKIAGALIAASTHWLTVTYWFQLCFPETTDLLPYQAGTYYPDGTNRRCRISFRTGPRFDWRVVLEAPSETVTEEFTELREYTLECLAMEPPQIRVHRNHPRAKTRSFTSTEIP